MIDFIRAYFLTIIIEWTILYLILKNKQNEKFITRNAIIASSLTLPFVWFVFPLLGFTWAIQTALAELFAFLVEAVLYRFLFNGINWKDAILASLLCNSTSFFISLAMI